MAPRGLLSHIAFFFFRESPFHKPAIEIQSTMSQITFLFMQHLDLDLWVSHNLVILILTASSNCITSRRDNLTKIRKNVGDEEKWQVLKNCYNTIISSETTGCHTSQIFSK